MSGGVTDFPVTLNSGEIVGRLSGGPGPSEAIPLATVAAYALGQLYDTSTSSLTVNTGSQTLVVSANKSFLPGQPISIVSSASPANTMIGSVTSYSALTGQLVVNVTSTTGSGTAAAWIVSVTGAVGPAGPVGPTGGSIVSPQGRLTLVTGTPVMTADEVAQTTIYYTPYVGNQIPIGGVVSAFSELSVVLDSTNALSTNLYDLFVYKDGNGVIRLGYGPAWSSATARSAAISMSNGIWTNSSTITLRYSSSATNSISANQATYVGTFYATSNGHTGMAFAPTAASGGTANILGLYNAYNRVRTVARESSSTSSWTYATATWRAANASNSNRVSWVDGLAQSFVEVDYSTIMSADGAVASYVAVGIDSTSDPTTGSGSTTPEVISATAIAATAHNSSVPLLGFHYAQALEYSSGSTTTYGGGGPSGDNLKLRIEM